ncbi:translesion DNA synthesis-associated protein ImuA [soil metagenome]
MTATESRSPAVSQLDLLLDSGRVWRGGPPPVPAVATGHLALDARLPGGGWPGHALTEILSEPWGSGELGLVMPALARLSEGEQWIAWVGAPFLPYAPAIASHGVDLSRLLFVRPGQDVVWVMEQALRSGTCAAVVGWERQAGMRHLRRLQLAAEEAGVCCLLFRPCGCRSQASPAALRLCVTPEAGGLRIDILKCRGARPGSVVLARPR